MRSIWKILPVFLILGACGDPLAGVERVSDGAILPDANLRTALPTQDELDRQDSFLSGLLAPDGQDVNTAQSSGSGKDPAPVAPSDLGQNSVRSASVAQGAGDSPQTTSDRVAPQKRCGVFGTDAPGLSAGLALRDVAMRTTLPFGEVARVCGARPRDLETLIEKAARKGPGYALYDSVPNSAAARTFYVTGFSDNCVRQFTAALATFGAPEFHEQLRYGLPAKEYPYSSTDRAYEKIKAKVCNVGRNKP